MFIDFLLDIFEKYKDDDAIVWHDEVYSYGWLLSRIEQWQGEIDKYKIFSGTVSAVEAEFSPNSVALFLALVERGCIFVPLTKSVSSKKEEFIQTSEAELCFIIDEDDDADINHLPKKADHYLYQILRNKKHPGLVLFSSGSTGKSKAAVHDLTGLLNKFRVTRHRYRTLTFLLYDHIGGLNTLLYALSNGGTVVTVQDRNPDSVLHAIERHGVDLLPTSPTFLNLIILSEAYKSYDLSSLKLVTYGTEYMPEITLKRFHELYPNIRLLQTYGLSEVGILRSKSERSDSLWIKVGGEGFETRVVNGILHIKAKSAMLGYLNAPSPFTEDGWFDTDDSVEVKGEYIRILGRQSEIINVGGEKVYPAEVESVIQEMDNIREATVYKKKNPITGNIVCAKVNLNNPEDPKQFITRLKRHCRQKLQNYKVPVKVTIEEEKQHSERFKKIRKVSK